MTTPTRTPRAKRSARAPKKAAPLLEAPSSADILRAEQLVEVMQRLSPERIKFPALLAKHPRLLLVGEAGSGKTTLIAYLATKAARGELAAEAGFSDTPVPLVLPVLSLAAVPSSREALAAAVDCDAQFLGAMLQQGRAFLLVDGLDEARPAVAGGLLDAVIAHVEAHPGNRLLVTTRPAGPGAEKEPTHPKLATSRLVPMTRDEVDRFIVQWCLAAEVSVQKDSGRARAEEDARKASDDLKARVRSSRAVERLAETPLLCSVLCIVHRFMGQRIPERRAALYEVTTNVLLYEWDRAKFPEASAVGKLDAPEKRLLLGHLARSMHEAGVAELSAEEVIARIGERLPDLGRPAEDARAIVDEIRDRSGVLVERTAGVFAFSHLTFQEYLTALDVVRTRDYELLLSKHDDPRWHEVIALAAGIPGADAAKIIESLLSLKGESLEAGTVLAASCAETSIDLAPSIRNHIERRMGELILSTDNTRLSRLAVVGAVPESVFFRRLQQTDPDDVASVLRLLVIIGQDSSVAPVARLLTSPMWTTRDGGWWTSENMPIAAIAAFTLAFFSKQSDLARKTLADNLPTAHPAAIMCVRVLAAGVLSPWCEIAKRILDDAGLATASPEPPVRAD